MNFDLTKSAVCNERLNTFVFIAVLAFVKIAICIETDMYVPSFPQMVKDLHTTETQIQGVLGLNFLGLCLSNLWAGPLADSFGRRKIILIGLSIFAISSLGCVWSSTLSQLLFWRFIQGLGAGTPMTAGFAILMDRFDSKVAASLIGFMNTVITLSMAGAPILGTWITFHYHWRANFILIFILSILAWITFYLTIPETLSEKDKVPLNLKEILKKCGHALIHPQFMAYTMICIFIFAGIIVFVTNQSLIFINYLKIGPEVYGFYQASSMASFACASLISGALIRRFGVAGVKHACLSFTTLGGASLLGTAVLYPLSAKLICFSITLISFGGGLGIGSIAAAAMGVFPHMRATASGLMGFLRLMITSGMVSLSAHYFTGSIFPVAIIIGSSQAIACVIYLFITINRTESAEAVESSFDTLPAIH